MSLPIQMSDYKSEIKSLTTLVDITTEHLTDFIASVPRGIHVFSGEASFNGISKRCFASKVSKELKRRGIEDQSIIECDHTHDFHKAMLNFSNDKLVILLIESDSLIETLNKLRAFRAVSYNDLEKIKSITHSSIYPTNDCGDVKTSTESALMSAGKLTTMKVFSGYDNKRFEDFKDGSIPATDFIEHLSECKDSFLERKIAFIIYKELFGNNEDCFTCTMKKLSDNNIPFNAIFEHVSMGWLAGELSYEETIKDVRFLLF